MFKRCTLSAVFPLHLSAFGATIAGPYSLRSKSGATVSMPLEWDEVKPGLTIQHFNIHNAIPR